MHDDRVTAVQEEPNVHYVFYQRDVTDGTRSPWKLLDDESDERVIAAKENPNVHLSQVFCAQKFWMSFWRTRLSLMVACMVMCDWT